MPAASCSLKSTLELEVAMKVATKMLLLVVLLSVGACQLSAQAKAPAKKAAAGAKSAKAKAKAKAAAQDRTPVEQLQVYVDGFHNHKRDANLDAEQQKQIRVTHYCQALNPDFIQCAVYDGNSKNARLIGLEHIISDKDFQALPDNEKAFWHPHDGEVDSGMLDLPGMAEAQKTGMLQMIRSTHGKTWHVWESYKDKIPMGEPSLMWAIDKDKANSETKRGMEQRKKDPKF